jgi:hypothetical protein
MYQKIVHIFKYSKFADTFFPSVKYYKTNVLTNLISHLLKREEGELKI